MAFNRMSADQVKKFKLYGYVVLPNFLSSEDIDDLKNASKNVIRNIKDSATLQTFSKDGKMTKIAHTLHWFDPTFKTHTFSEKVKNCVKDLGFEKPMVPQSKYIFNNPGIDDEELPHQDGTFLHVDPGSAIDDPMRLLGFYFMLDESDKNTGCSWFIPGSQGGPIARKLIANDDVNSKEKYIFNKSLKEYFEDQFQAVPAPKGSCLILHGRVVHKTTNNNSANPRNVYSFRVVEEKDTKWADSNWLKPTKDYSFPMLYEN